MYGKYPIKYVKTMSVGVCKFMFFPCFCVGHHQNHPEPSCISPLILPMFEVISPWKEVLGTGPAVRNEYSSRFVSPDKKVFNSIHRYIYIYTWFKVTFWFPSWRSLNHLKGHLTILKRSRRIARYSMASSTTSPWIQNLTCTTNDRLGPAFQKGSHGRTTTLQASKNMGDFATRWAPTSYK